MINITFNRRTILQPRYRVCLIFLLSLILLANGLSQTADTSRIITEDGWIEKFKNSLGPVVTFSNNYETFKVDTEANDIVLYPNITTVAQIGFFYRFIRFDIGFAPDFLPGNGDENIKGLTSSFNLGFTMFFRHWIQSLSYNRVRGYYLKNTEDYVAWQKGDAYIQFPDLYYKGFSGSTGYLLNPRLSVKSFSLHTERQLKSAGSFVVLLNYRFYNVDDKSTPSPGGATQTSDNFDVSLAPGYYYNYVLKQKFYAALGFSPGIGFIRTKLTTRYSSGDIKSDQRNFAFRWEGKGAIGYNSSKFFTGIYVNVTGLNYRQENTTVVNSDTRVFYELFLGMRFNAPGPVNRFFDKVGI